MFKSILTTLAAENPELVVMLQKAFQTKTRGEGRAVYLNDSGEWVTFDYPAVVAEIVCYAAQDYRKA